MPAQVITCTICNARFRVSQTQPQMTASDATRHVVREHGMQRPEAGKHLRGLDQTSTDSTPPWTTAQSTETSTPP